MSKLFIIPTPIGNLKDISERVLETIKESDFLLVEDTRQTGKLLHLLGIKKKMMSFHKFNEHEKLNFYLKEILNSTQVGLLSDAGMPGISDPGFLLIREALKNHIEVECLPGPVAFIPALVVSGFSTERFCFEGFIPVKKGRKTRLESLADEMRTMVFYESPHKLLKTLNDFKNEFGPSRRCSVSREISKKFEEHVRGTLEEVCEMLDSKKPKGEFVIVVEGKGK